MALLATVGVALASCGGGGGDSGGGGTGSGGSGSAVDQELDQLYEAAVDSGETTVTLYGAAANNWEPVVAAFNERFPDITVDLVSLIGADLITRLTAEFASGQHEGDVVFSPISQGVFTPEYEEWLDPFEPVGVGDLPEWAVQPDDLWVVPYVAVFGVAYNTEQLSAEEAPEDWAALADPEWQGRVGMDDPTVASGTSVAMTYALHGGQIDEAWMEDFAENDPVVFSEGARRTRALITGEIDACIYPLGVLAADQRNGAPVAFAPGTAATSPTGVAVLEGAPHPDAAKLFSAWLLTPEAGELYAGQGQYPVLPGAPLPEGFEEGDPELTEPLTAEEFTQTFARVREVWTELLG